MWCYAAWWLGRWDVGALCSFHRIWKNMAKEIMEEDKALMIYNYFYMYIGNVYFSWVKKWKVWYLYSNYWVVTAAQNTIHNSPVCIDIWFIVAFITFILTILTSYQIISYVNCVYFFSVALLGNFAPCLANTKVTVAFPTGKSKVLKILMNSNFHVM